MRVVWSRTIVAGFWLITAAYCLLSAIPFASEQFLKPGLVPALATFAAWHPWISLAALVATGAGLAPWLRSGHRGARAFIAGWGIVGVTLFIASAACRNSSLRRPRWCSRYWGSSRLCWIALMDLSGERPPQRGRTTASKTTCHATLLRASSRHLS